MRRLLLLALVLFSGAARAQVSAGSVRIVNSTGLITEGVTAHAATGGNGGHVFAVQNAPAALGAGQVGFMSADTSARLIVVGAGTAGSAAGGVVSIQGVASGTTVPVSGTVTATVASVGATGSAVPASADYLGLSNAGTLIGALSGTGVRAAGVLRVTIATDDIVPASQSGTWNITNVSGTVSLPTGASTEATLAKLAITQGAALGSNTVAMMGGSVTTAAPTYTTGQISPLSLDTSGSLRTATTLSGAAAFSSFQTTVTGAAAALAANAAKHACVIAFPTNTDIVYIGATGVTSGTGTPLYPGWSWCEHVTNTNLIFVLAASGTQTLSTAWTN